MRNTVLEFQVRFVTNNFYHDTQKFRAIFHSQSMLQIKEIEGNFVSESLSLKCKISAIRFVETVCIVLIFFIAELQISMERETQES